MSKVSTAILGLTLILTPLQDVQIGSSNTKARSTPIETIMDMCEDLDRLSEQTCAASCNASGTTVLRHTSTCGLNSTCVCL